MILLVSISLTLFKKIGSFETCKGVPLFDN